MKPIVSLVVTDLDNTVWDWVEIWGATFRAMFEKIEAISGLPRETLEADIQAVFQRHRTSEYSSVIQEMVCLREKHPGEDLAVIYEDAIVAFRETRREVLRLYPGVRDTLERLNAIRCPVVAYTESMSFYTMSRLRDLEVDGLLDYVYSTEDHKKPATVTRRYPEEHYELQHAVQRRVPVGEVKPNPRVLLDIIQELHGDLQRTIYIGDSLMKDVPMAQKAGVMDVHAEYGLEAQRTEAYEVLKRVTHWSKRDVSREEQLLGGRAVSPTFVLRRSIEELFDLFEFVPGP